MARRLRSVLFLPASNSRAIAKARDLPCDAVILDLEDAVAPEAKADARAAAVAALAEGFGDRVAVVRVNAGDTDWAADDLAAVARAQLDAVLLPKVGSVVAVEMARAALGPDMPIWAMIESARGILALPALAEAATRLNLAALAAGTNDLAKDLRARPGLDRAPLIPALSQIVVTARAAGMIALDGVLNAIDDADRLTAECAQGAALGFDGKSLIHPSQIDAANRAFAPSDAEVAWARAVIAAFAVPEADGKGAIRVAGAMVERLHLAEAEWILAGAP